MGYGEATSDEMLLNFFLMTKYKPGDQNIIIDSSAFFLTDTGGNAGENLLPEIVVSPNPVDDEFIVSFNLPENGLTQLELFDIYGHLSRRLFPERVMESGTYSYSYHSGSMPAGIYFLRLKNADKSCVSKLVLTGN